MIRKRVIASRYAEAFIKYARETIGKEKAVSDIQRVRDTLRENSSLKECLENPQVPFTEKCRLIDEIIQDGFSDEIRHFLKLLIDHRRIVFFHDIAEYIRVTYCHEGEEEALLKTTFPLDIDLIKRIQDFFEQRLDKKLKFYIELDSRLLGGIQVMIGNRIFDGSLKRQLANLKERLIAARIN